MKIKISLIDDDGKEFSGEVRLTPETEKSKSKMEKTKKIKRGGQKFNYKILLKKISFKTLSL